MDIAGTITAVTAAIGFAKELVDVNAQLDQAELKLKVAELTTALATAKLGLVDVNDQMRAMDNEITRLTKQLAFKEANVVQKGNYSYRSFEGYAMGYPFCPVCEAQGVYINIVQDRGTGTGIKYRCPRCKSDYGSHLTAYTLPEDVRARFKDAG